MHLQMNQRTISRGTNCGVCFDNRYVLFCFVTFVTSFRFSFEGKISSEFEWTFTVDSSFDKNYLNLYLILV